MGCIAAAWHPWFCTITLPLPHVNPQGFRSDFNGETFTAPYVIAGVNSDQNTYVYQDGVGNQARFGNPYSEYA